MEGDSKKIAADQPVVVLARMEIEGEELKATLVFSRPENTPAIYPGDSQVDIKIDLLHEKQLRIDVKELAARVAKKVSEELTRRSLL